MNPNPRASRAQQQCPLCSGRRREVFQARILHKYVVHYFLCEACGLLQTEEPYWLDEAYGKAIADADTGLLTRNIDIAEKLAGLLYFCFDPQAQYLESAGGYGLLTRLMRDKGFDFRWQDPYCENIFARGFEWDQVTGSAVGGAITAFEVIEHIMDPVAFIRGGLAQAKTNTIIFSTILYQGEPPLPEDWWYYALSTGQHISFFRRETLQILSDHLKLRLYTNGWIHVLTDRQIPTSKFRICTGRLSSLVDAYVRCRMQSKTFTDHQRITGGM